MKNLAFKSMTETAEIVFEKIKRMFPQMDAEMRIGKGRLSHLVHNKPEYQLGFVFPLVELSRNQNVGLLIYYPITREFIQTGCQLHEPVRDGDKEIGLQTDRGFMRVETLENEKVITFTAACLA